MRLLRSVLLACFLLLLPLFAAWGVTFPVLSGPQAYIGQFKQENEAYAVLLILSEDRKFLLQERFVLPNGKKSSWEVAGKWSQIRAGSFLQLSNASHFSRQVNVGGTGNLYMGIQLPTGSLVTVPLRPQSIDDHGQDFRRLASIDPSTLEAPSGQEGNFLAASVGEEPALPVAVPLHLRKKQAPAVAVTMTSWRNGEEFVQGWKNIPRSGRGTNAVLPEGPGVVRPEPLLAVAEQPRLSVARPTPLWKEGYLLSSVNEPRLSRGLVAVVPVVSAAQLEPSLAVVEQPRQQMVLPVASWPTPSWKDEYMLAFVSPKSEALPQVVTPIRPEQPEHLLAVVEQSRQSVVQPAPLRTEDDLLSSVDEFRESRALAAAVPVVRVEQPAVTPAAVEQPESLLVVAEQPRQSRVQPAPFRTEDDLLPSVDEFRESRVLAAAVLVARAEQAALSLAAEKQPRKSVLPPTRFWKDRYILSSAPQQRDTRKGKSQRQRFPERQIMSNAWQGGGRIGNILSIHQTVRS